MYRKILVPLDGSALSERALPFAQRVAHGHGAQLVLVRVVEAQVLPERDVAGTADGLVELARNYLEAVAARLAPGTIAETSVLCGHPASDIVAEAALHRADLVVMSTRGRTGLGRLLLGSVADEVLRQCPVPVLLVPAAAQPWEDNRPLRTLVPLDGSAGAEEALDVLGSLAEPGLVEKAVLLSTLDLTPSLVYAGAGLPDVGDSLAGIDSYLQRIGARLRRVGVRVEPEVTVGQAAATIVDCARGGLVDLIAMATHGRGGLARFIMGSVAAGVLAQVDVPVLLTRPRGLVRADYPRGRQLSLTSLAGSAA